MREAEPDVEGLIGRLHAANKCNRCGCSACEDGYENHSHSCTGKPGCVETQDKLRSRVTSLIFLAMDAAKTVSALLDEVEGLRETVQAATDTLNQHDAPTTDGDGGAPLSLSGRIDAEVSDWAETASMMEDLARSEKAGRERAEGLVEMAMEAIEGALDLVTTDEEPQSGMSWLYLPNTAYDALEKALAKLSTPNQADPK